MIVKEITNKKVVLDSPAKINLFLEVLNKRADGYHNINSLFQAISLADTVEFEKKDKPGISIEIINDVDLTINDDNLIAKSYYLLQKKYEIPGGLKVKLKKEIPIGAGLGGGSSNAASTILALNILFDLGLSYPEMADLSAIIGSDVPFFFSSGQALVSVRGEIINEVKLPLNYQILLVKPSFSISTPKAYQDLKRGLTNHKIPFSLQCNGDLDDFVEMLKSPGNDFENNALLSYPELIKIREWLLNIGAKLVRMSGSGPTVFGIFGEASSIEHPDIVKQGDWRMLFAKPITLENLS